jgi:hypothetical protein
MRAGDSRVAVESHGIDLWSVALHLILFPPFDLGDPNGSFQQCLQRVSNPQFFVSAHQPKLASQAKRHHRLSLADYSKRETGLIEDLGRWAAWATACNCSSHSKQKAAVDYMMANILRGLALIFYFPLRGNNSNMPGSIEHRNTDS